MTAKPEEEGDGEGEDEAAPEEECQVGEPVCVTPVPPAQTLSSARTHAIGTYPLAAQHTLHYNLRHRCTSRMMFFQVAHGQTHLHSQIQQAEFKPVVQLDEVETSTGEEDEEALLEL